MNKEKVVVIGTTKVEVIKTDKATYQVDAVLMCVGFSANTKFLSNSGIKMNQRGVIIVDNQQQTNIEDVYAIGDFVTMQNNATKNPEHIALASNAVRSGIVAGHNAGGLKISNNRVQGSNTIHICGLTLTSTGLNSVAAEMNGYDIDSVIVTDTIKANFMPTNDEVTLKIAWNKKTLKILDTT